LRKTVLYCSSKDLYQFIGHIPVGFGPTIDLFENDKSKYKSITVCLDTSNSFLGTTYNEFAENTTSKAVLIPSTGNISINVHETIANLPIKKFTKKDFDIYCKKSDSTLIFTSDIVDKKILLDYTCQLNSLLFEQIKLTTNKLFYHGNYFKSGKQFHVCTYNGIGFNKCLLIITDDELQKLFIPYIPIGGTHRRYILRKI
jgi:hypothetical protein